MCYAPLEPLSTRHGGRGGAALDVDACGPEKQPALQGGSPGGSAGGLGPARRGRLGSQNTKPRSVPAATLWLVASPSASRRVIELLEAQLHFLCSVKRVLQQNGIGATRPYKPLSVLNRADYTVIYSALPRAAVSLCPRPVVALNTAIASTASLCPRRRRATTVQ